jgi:two-component system NarL family sensor kinase
MVERYRYDTGINAKFVCDVTEETPPPSVCREMASIVQEALANVLKHSFARNVLILLGSDKQSWILNIDDDGRGFEFYGKLSHPELEGARSGPSIIRERVRSLGGELSIDSRPGRGARLEITIPKQTQRSSA